MGDKSEDLAWRRQQAVSGGVRSEWMHYVLQGEALRENELMLY